MIEKEMLDNAIHVKQV